MKWSDKVTSLRKRLGVSQKQFCELINVSQATGCLWEKGKRTPSGMAERFVSFLYVVTNPDECKKSDLKLATAEMRKELDRGRAFDALLSLLVYLFTV